MCKMGKGHNRTFASPSLMWLLLVGTWDGIQKNLVLPFHLATPFSSGTFQQLHHGQQSGSGLIMGREGGRLWCPGRILQMLSLLSALLCMMDGKKAELVCCFHWLTGLLILGLSRIQRERMIPVRLPMNAPLYIVCCNPWSIEGSSSMPALVMAIKDSKWPFMRALDSRRTGLSVSELPSESESVGPEGGQTDRATAARRRKEWEGRRHTLLYPQSVAQSGSPSVAQTCTYDVHTGRGVGGPPKADKGKKSADLWL